MPNKEITTKVCIIGAGFAGLVIANILQKYNIACVLIEKCSEAEIYNRHDLGLIDRQTVEILKKYGLSDRLIDRGILQDRCEFRTLEQSFILNYGQKCRHQAHYIYSQQSLTIDLIDKLYQNGGEIWFDTQATAMINDSQGAKVECKQKEETITINCDFVAGCDGVRGISRPSIPQTIIKLRYKDFNYSWLAITAEIAPSTEHIIYGIHPKGFAGYMPNDETTSRYYLQIPKGDTVAQWSDRIIWSELQLRLAQDDSTTIDGEIINKQVLRINSFITQTMQYRRLFLAGNSAHTMTPAGGKDINVAIQDADALGQALVSYCYYHHNLPLRNYSATRLSVVRKMQQFSTSLLQMINTQDNSTPEGKSIERVQKFKRSQLMNSDLYALDFSRKYVGYTAAKPSSKCDRQQPFATAS